MSILQIFNLKKDYEKLSKDGCIDGFVIFTKNTIKKAAKDFVDKDGAAKKQFVIDTVAKFLADSAISATNPLLGRIITFLLPIIVEHLYAALREYVDGLTVQEV